MFLWFIKGLLINTLIDTQEVDPKVESDEPLEAEGMESFISELTNAIPGIDEAMSFAEMLKWVHLFCVQ